MATKIKFQYDLDVAQLAKAIVDASTGTAPEPATDARSPAAVALGKRGASKGGKVVPKRTRRRRKQGGKNLLAEGQWVKW